MKLLEFQKRKSMIFTLEIKMKHFTVSAVKSKQIELQRSAWWPQIAFSQSFLMVTDFYMFLWIICPQFKKTWRTLILSKIVVLGEKQRQRYFQRVIPPNINDFVVSGKIVCRIDFQLTKCIQNSKKVCVLTFSQKLLQNSFHLGPIWHL